MLTEHNNREMNLDYRARNQFNECYFNEVKRGEYGRRNISNRTCALCELQTLF